MRTLTLIAFLFLSGCYANDEPEEPEEPQGVWFDSPAANESILQQAFVNSVFIIDPKSAVFSNVLKKNSKWSDKPDWCGFVRLKNRFGNYIGQRVFHVTLLTGKPYLAGFQGSDIGLTPERGCRGTIFSSLK